MKEYIRNQLREDYIVGQLSLFEEYDPFTGKKSEEKIRNPFSISE